MSTFESKERQEKHQKKKRKVTACQATAEDYASLREHYTFLPPGSTGAVSSSSSSSAAAAAAASSFSNHHDNTNNTNTNNATVSSSTWQTRMVARYHEHLDKDYVLANMTRAHSPHYQLGLRWRTKAEVQSGKGSKSCGNLHCPAALNKCQAAATTTAAVPHTDDDKKAHNIQRHLQKEEEEHGEETADERVVERLAKLLPEGHHLLTDYIVPFTYQEHGATKTQLVKLKLCATCAPLLFISQGKKNVGSDPSSAKLEVMKQQQQTTTKRLNTGGGRRKSSNNNNKGP